MVMLNSGITGIASVPFGSSAGRYEALTLLDADPARYCGRGMLKSAHNVNNVIAPAIVGTEVFDQKEIDAQLIALDVTARRQHLGGNSILSVSLACARAACASRAIPLYKYVRETYGLAGERASLPKPMMVVVEGGRHADDSTDLQEYMVGIRADVNSRDAVRAGIEIYHTLGKLLKAQGYAINVGLEGAYAPAGMQSNKEPLIYIQEAIVDAGYEPMKEVAIALDPAASEFYKDGSYRLERENRTLSAAQLISYYEELVSEYPIFSIEDGLGEDDWNSWTTLNERLGKRVMNVGDDLTATNVTRLQKAIDLKAINAILIKPNQVGTLSETVEATTLAKEHGLNVIVSHRGGGETTDTLIIDLAVAASADFVKVGPSRGERVVKYNRLMEIEEEVMSLPE
jgi:enolase